MKQFLIFIVCCIQFKAWSQAPTQTSLMHNLYAVLNDSTLSIDDYFNQTDSLMHQIYPNDTSEGGPINSYEKWREFFSNRIGINAKPTHLMKNYLKAWKEAKTRSITNCSGNFTGNWVNFGPKNFSPTYQNQGVINDIWVDPDDAQFIYAASEGGGLWKSVNGGGSWTNITDNNNLSLGTIGINVIAVSPANRDHIYISTKLYRHFNNSHAGGNDGMHLNGLALGIYHTTNGGNTWTKISLPPGSGAAILDPDFLSAFDIRYSPTLVNGNDFVVLTHRREFGAGFDEVYTKFGNNPWVLVNPTGLTPAFIPCIWPLNGNINTLVDIEFNSQFPGQYFISSGADNYDHCNGLWRFNFNQTNGNPISFEEIINSKFNSAPITTLYSFPGPPVTHTDITMASNRMEFGNNGIIRVYSVCMSDNLCNYFAGEQIITEWQVNATGPATYLSTLINIPGSGISNADGLNVFEYDPANPDIMYFGNEMAAIAYKQGGVWKYKTLENYNEAHFDDYPIHPDCRKILLYKSGTAVANHPGINDTIFWGNDGGISRTTNHDITQIIDHNSWTIGTGSEDKNVIRKAVNLNGDGLYIGDMYDVDSYNGLYGNFRSSASYHDGYQLWNKATDKWHGAISGDGMTAKFEKRETLNSPTAINLIYRENTDSRRLTYNPVTFTGPLFYGGTYLGVESGLIRYTPLEYNNDNDRVHLSIKRSWQSDINAYTFPATGNFFNITGGGLFDGAALSSTNCTAFTELNPNDAYFARNTHLGGVKIVNRRWLNPGSGTVQWKDITPSQVGNPSPGYVCSDLVVDPLDVNRVWVALAGIADVDEVDRVLYNPNGTSAAGWVDMSIGLGRLSVNCLAYQSGSDDIIYAGTDDGVYYWNKPTQCWVKMNNNMPNVMVTRLTIDYQCGKLLAATYGRGLWEIDLYTPQPVPDVTDIISTPGTTIWNTNKNIEGSILIKSGSKLRIEGTPTNTGALGAIVPPFESSTTIFMPKMGAIYVERGAILEVSGAEITNQCSHWYGIQAYGFGWPQSFPNPLLPNYDPYHGVVILNKAIISNAEEAFTNAGGSPGCCTNTGGIILADWSVFYNNRRSAQFLQFENWTNVSAPAVLKRDFSHFGDCQFIVDDESRQEVESQITMWRVNGVNLRGNRFTNNQNLEQSHMAAIGTIDASYVVEGNSPGKPLSIIEKFHEGVRSESFWVGLTGHPIVITGTKFDENEIGIHLSNMHYPSILKNEIKIGAKQTPIPSASYIHYSLGSMLDHVSNFVYCENVHTKPYVAPVGPPAPWLQYTTGFEVWNTGAIDQDVSKNSYDGLLIGTDCEMICATPTGDKGINFRCNTNTNNTRFDFLFQSTPFIRKTQDFGPGFSKSATRNTFTFPPPINFRHWYHENGGNAPVDYFHNSSAVGNEIPTAFNPGNIILNATPSLPACSLINCQSIKVIGAFAKTLTTSELEDLKTEFNTEETAYNTYLSTYQQLLDAGDTYGTIEDIENSPSSEALMIRAEMLALSPYVSQDVLRTLVNEGILSNAFLLEIILANPDATQDESFIHFLEFEAPIPFPAFMIALIQNSWDGSVITLRTVLEDNMGIRHQRMSELKREIITIMRVDEDFYNEVSIFEWMQKVPSLRNSYEVIEYLLAKKEYNQAELILNNLPTNYRFSQLDDLEHTTYTSLYNFKKDLLINGVEINELNSTQIEQLRAIADVSDECFPRAMARAALCFFYKICYPMSPRSIPEIPITRNAAPMHQPLEGGKEVIAYPNPANDYVAFYFDMNNKNEVRDLLVTDMMGNPVYSRLLKGTKGQYVWDTQKISSGQYVYFISTLSGEKYTGKITIQK